MGFQGKGRPPDRHLDEQELDALVALSLKSGQEVHWISPHAIDEAERHVEACGMCRGKVSKYRQLVNRFSKDAAPESAPRGADCPQDQDVDWYEVAAGLWPESKARQLILHAALCDHCGPILRRATSVVDEDPTPQEERLLTELRAPSRPAVKAAGELIPDRPLPSPAWRQLLQWTTFVPAVALVMIVGVLVTRSSSSGGAISGPKFAEFAVNAHRQYAQGNLALEVRSDSPQVVNEWFQTKSQFSLALPASPLLPGEERPYRVEGARLLPVDGKPAAYVAYRAQADLVSLMVTPDSVALASGGVEMNFTKLSFHYTRVEGYKVVTWSVHGLTYALVSQEGNSTQRSCMVCHSAMKDRDLSRTPTPLQAAGNTLEPKEQ
jgi:anti-sigma factor RsiW